METSERIGMVSCRGGRVLASSRRDQSVGGRPCASSGEKRPEGVVGMGKGEGRRCDNGTKCLSVPRFHRGICSCRCDVGVEMAVGPKVCPRATSRCDQEAPAGVVKELWQGRFMGAKRRSKGQSRVVEGGRRALEFGP
eukprot:366082-Chlamydomonas_euryale.AAC.37